MRKKQTIIINESQLEQIVSQSVKTVLKENFGDKLKDFWNDTAFHQLHHINKQNREDNRNAKAMKFVDFRWLKKETTGAYQGWVIFEITSKNGDKESVGNIFIGQIDGGFSFKHLQPHSFSVAMSKILKQVLLKYEREEPGTIIPLSKND